MKRTPLHRLHEELGARMVPFAGWSMPVQYPAGILREHAATRARAGLFDVSHMGQIELRGADAATALERLVPAGITALAPGVARYTILTSDEGGVLDDLIVAHAGDHLSLVVNAANCERDLVHLRDRLPPGCTVMLRQDLALLALQGPQAEAVLARVAPAVAGLRYMQRMTTPIAGIAAVVTRAGYTGEDGFEIAVLGEAAEKIARLLLEEGSVVPVGLGARDTLRLEAGFCLHGQDLDQSISPVEAGLAWTIPRARREAGGFPGAARILRELASGAPRRLVGLRLDGSTPARRGAPVEDAAGAGIGIVTSGGHGPTVGGPVALALIASDAAAPGQHVTVRVRDKPLPARTVPLPFVPHRMKRAGSSRP